MYRHIFTIFALTLTAACAPVVPLIGDGSAENTANENTAKLLAQSLTDAIEQGDYTDEQWHHASQEGTARLEYQDDSWVGRVEGDLSWTWTDDEGEWVLVVALEGFGAMWEEFNGVLDVTVSVDDGYSPTSDKGFTMVFDGTLDSSIGGVVEIDLEVEVDHTPGYRKIEWGGTVDDEPVAGHVAKKEELHDSQGGDCKSPIGVDCE